MNIVRKYASHKEGRVITILNMSYTQGLESSMNAGVDLAIGDFVYEFDSPCADFDWSTAMEIYRRSLKGFDIVSACLDKKMRFTSKLFYAVFNRYAKLQYRLETETFRILSRRAINRIHSITSNIPYRKAAYANCGLAISSIKYKPTERVVRRKRSGRMAMGINSLILFTDVAFRVTLTLATTMALIAVGMGVYALIYKLLQHPVEGWATTIIFLSFGFFGLFLIMAMVLKYQQTLVSLVFRKKNYLFESIEKLQ
jgi:dolichol-phosphate mannosyltransferase